MIFYHYTSAAGLRGILESKSLWATDHRFLNDTSEFTHGWAIVFDALKRRKVELEDAAGEVWNTIEDFHRYNEREGVFAFVGSLSLEGDLLSQWRGYGGGKGFAIGFNADWLQQNATEQGFDIPPVVYLGSPTACSDRCFAGHVWNANSGPKVSHSVHCRLTELRLLTKPSTRGAMYSSSADVRLFADSGAIARVAGGLRRAICWHVEQWGG